MILDKGHRLLIARTSNTEGLVFEVASENGKYSLAVFLETEERILIKKIKFGFVGGLLLTFKATNANLLAKLHLQTNKIDFSLPSGEPKGRARESSWSLFGGVDVEDEFSQTLGSIKYGFKKDRIFLSGGREAGFIIRSPQKNLPRFLSPSNAHLIERFELFNELTEFDERLLFAWISRKMLAERAT